MNTDNLNRLAAGLKALAPVLVCILVGCASFSSPNESLDIPTHAFNAQSRYAVLWVKPCSQSITGGCIADDGRTTEAKFVAHGSVGRVDLKQQYEDSVGLSASIARFNSAASFEKNYLWSVKQTLSNKGLDVIAVAEPIHEGVLKNQSSSRVSFNDVSGAGATQFPLQLKSNNFDFSALYERLGVDYLVVMELLRFSVEQHFGPTGKPRDRPQVVSAVRLYVHEKETGETLFNDYAYRSVTAPEGWDEPPFYNGIESTLQKTLIDSINEAKRHLLQ